MATNSGEAAPSKKRRGPYLQFLSNPSKKTPKSTFYDWNKQAEQQAGEAAGSDVHAASQTQNNDLLLTTSNFEVSLSSSPSLDGSSALHSDLENLNNEGSDYIDDSADIPRDSANDDANEEPDLPDMEPDMAEHDDVLIDDLYDLDSDEETDHESKENRETSSLIAEEERQYLYKGAPITLGASLLLIMTFAVRHGLSGVALADLLILIELHCITPNLCRTSMKLLRAFFKQLRCPIELHYYCTFCRHYIGREKGPRCPNTHCLQDLTIPKNSSYFVVVPLATQLCSLLNRKYNSLLLLLFVIVVACGVIMFLVSISNFDKGSSSSSVFMLNI